MAREYQSVEARYCADLFSQYAKQAEGNPMLSLMLSSVGDLVMVIDSTPEAQAKVREILDTIVAEWPTVIRKETCCDGAGTDLSCDSE